jgi:hypothetical protein
MGSPANALAPGRYYGAVLIDALPGLDGGAAFVPFALTRAAGGDDVIDALTLGADGQRNYVIEPGESLRHIFIDIPDTRVLGVHTVEPGGGNAASMSFYAARADFPGASLSPQVDAAPPIGAAAAQWSLGGSISDKSVSVPVTPGRWYIVATNTGSARNGFTLITMPQSGGGGGGVSSPAPGAYYNPARSGHGIFMNRGGDQQALFWYTYLEDGTPVWYQAQSTAPDAGAAVWRAPLARINWMGNAVNATTIVGDVILTPISASEFMFSWHLDGIGGSEHFALLGADTCVTFNGAQADFTGQWYAPAQPGYGMDVLALPSVQFNAFYLYDALGQPHWLAASTPSFMPDTSADLNQFSGFCPTCSYAPTTHQVVGSLSVNYADATHGTYAANANLLPPLSGAWNINQPIARLTGKTTCSP